MLSFKRFSYIVLIVALLGLILLVFTTGGSRTDGLRVQNSLAPEREFLPAGQTPPRG